MLPDGFKWVPRHQYADREIALELDGHQVAMLLQRVDGTWFARLEVQRPFEEPLVKRPCTSFEAGKAGCEMWACRHEARLRAEVAAVLAGRRR